MEEFQQQNTFIIKDLETLRIIADPLRQQILELLSKETLTVKQLGDKFGLTANKLYYHINLLEKHGLVRVVETRMVSNMIEKTYRTTAPGIEIDPSLFSFHSEEGKEHIRALLNTVMETTRDDFLRTIQVRALALEKGEEEHPRQAILNRSVGRIPEDRADEFRERLKQLIQDFEAADQPDREDFQVFALTVAYYPSFYYPDDTP